MIHEERNVEYRYSRIIFQDLTFDAAEVAIHHHNRISPIDKLMKNSLD